MVPRCYPPIGRPIGTPPCDTHITWPWRLRPAVSYQSSGAASAPGGNTPRALYGAGADGHPEAPDRRPLGACPYRRQCAECSPSKFIGGPLQTVMGRRLRPSGPSAGTLGRRADAVNLPRRRAHRHAPVAAAQCLECYRQWEIGQLVVFRLALTQLLLRRWRGGRIRCLPRRAGGCAC